jgi:hypothetical protein
MPLAWRVESRPAAAASPSPASPSRRSTPRRKSCSTTRDFLLAVASSGKPSEPIRAASASRWRARSGCGAGGEGEGQGLGGEPVGPRRRLLEPPERAGGVALPRRAGQQGDTEVAVRPGRAGGGAGLQPLERALRRRGNAPAPAVEEELAEEGGGARVAGTGGAFEPAQAVRARLPRPVVGQHLAGVVEHRDRVAQLARLPVGLDGRRFLALAEALAGLAHPAEVVPGPALTAGGGRFEPAAGSDRILAPADTDQRAGADQVLGVGVALRRQRLDRRRRAPVERRGLGAILRAPRAGQVPEQREAVARPRIAGRRRPLEQHECRRRVVASAAAGVQRLGGGKQFLRRSARCSSGRGIAGRFNFARAGRWRRRARRPRGRWCGGRPCRGGWSRRRRPLLPSERRVRVAQLVVEPARFRSRRQRRTSLLQRLEAA